MMNNLLKKTTKHLSLFSVLMAAIVLLATLFTLVHGVNTAASVSDKTTLTVKMSSVYYHNDEQREKVEDVCEQVFEGKLDVLYVYRSAMTGDECELVYVFDEDAKVSYVKGKLEDKFQAKEFDGAFISLEQGKEVVKSAIPAVTVIRAAVAVLVFAILAFIYVAIRHSMQNAILVSSSILGASIVTTAILLLVRIPVTASTVYACVVPALIAPIFVLISLNKLRADESNNSAEDKVVNAIAVKETVAFTAALGAALVLLCIIATASARWFALCSLIGLFVSATIALFFIPSLQLPLYEKKLKADAERTKYGYVGAKKTEKEEPENN